MQIIESKKGAVRANHYHKTDSHVMYLLTGRARYRELNGVGEVVVDKVFVAGDSIHTPPVNPHGMEFLEDTLMVAAATNARTFDSYTNDIVRHKVL